MGDGADMAYEAMDLELEHMDRDNYYEEMLQGYRNHPFGHLSLAVQTAKDIWHEQHCKGHPVERVNSYTKQKFLGCSEFPRCRWSR